MNKKLKILSALSLTALIFLTIIPNITAVDLNWLPENEDILDYELAYENTTTSEIYIDGELTDITWGGQIWYRNESETTIAVIGEGFVELGEDFLGNELPSSFITTMNTNLDLGLPNDATVWDLYVAILNMIGQTTDIADEIGWDRAVKYESPDGPIASYFESIIIGTIETKMIVSLALDVSVLVAAYAGQFIGEAIAAVVQLFMPFISVFAFPSTSSNLCLTEPIASDDTDGSYTSDDEMIAFNSIIGDMYTSIPGFPVYITSVMSVFAIAMILNKKRK